ncbi:MAG: histidine kinase [Desulfosporosinus sp. BRH_c37]|nr:MAG: histidine kinase [Desulfosporosinus sp. BRH_c37]
MKILVVDDSNFVRSLVGKTLQINIPALELLMANNGVEGYNLYCTEKPDLIVMDLLMPEMNGWELIKKIREVDLNIKIIVLSADIQKATRDEIEQFGIIAFIHKPFNKEKAAQLINIVKEESGA